MPSGFRVVPNPNLERELGADVAKGVEAAAFGARDELSRRISKGPRSGKHYKDKRHPRRSSAPGEYPQEQLSDLKDSVNANQVTPLEFEVGFFGDQELIDKVLYLEYFGEPLTGAGIRRPLWMLFEGKDSKRTVNLMKAAVRKAMQ
jgi:hypothetical protein